MKRIIAMTLALVLGFSAMAQDKAKADRFQPKAGDWSIGLSINPMAASGFKYQPGTGEFIGAYIEGLAGNPEQMYIVGQPVTSFRYKRFITDKFAVKASLGFSGSSNTYKEYVSSDLAVWKDANSQEQVVDKAKANLGGGSLAIGVEGNLGKGALRFVYGLELVYSMGAGTMNFEYGNAFAPYNSYAPTTMGMAAKDGSLNEYKDEKLGIAWARPAVRNEIGLVQQVGLLFELGAEYFVYDRMSIGLTASILPAAYTWQGQTWGIYEGYSTYSMKIEQYNRLVSPGSHALTYGTGNLGINISLNYYF